jgi:Ca2+-binding EF-hand superfamily protein
MQILTKDEDVLTLEDIANSEEMRANHFARRICELFNEDGSGRLTYDKFLNMDAFSDVTPTEVKLVWAFAI